MAKTSKSVLSRIKHNLAKLCEADSTDQVVEVIRWKNKYCAEIMDLCTVEILQIEGVSITEPAAPPTDLRSTDQEPARNKLNMYLIKFTRPVKYTDPSPLASLETLDLFNSIQSAALTGLP